MVARQALVFDALAKVANEDADPSAMIDSLAPSVLQLVRDDALLPDMYRRGVSTAAIQELAPRLRSPRRRRGRICGATPAQTVSISQRVVCAMRTAAGGARGEQASTREDANALVWRGETPDII